MTDHQTRELIAGALDGSQGITKAHPYYRQTAKPGEALVSWAGLARDETGFGYLNTWEILIFLPVDVDRAEKALAEHLDAWIAALSEVLIVTEAQPSTLVLDAGTTPAVTITGVRARD